MSSTFSKRQVLPVVHYLNYTLALSEADLAFRAGADGVFLISHGNENKALPRLARILKDRYPGKRIGLNLLGESPLQALDIAEQAGLDMVWADNPGVSSAGWTEAGAELAEHLRNGSPVAFFGSVAFKYQPYEPEPGRAAVLAALNGMLPTTSGTATGAAPEIEKIRLMSEALAGGQLAVASGMTPGNVADYLPYITHYLVATGVSHDAHHFDEAKLSAFIRTVHEYQP